MIIGIAGGSGSGKTTFAKKLFKQMGPELAIVLEQDSYYKDQSQKFKKDPSSVNFDHPDALDFDLLCQHLKDLKNGLTIQRPQYDFVTHSRLAESISVSKKPIILLDGILIYTHPGIVAEVDMKFFLDAPELLRFERRLKRDTQERGRSPEDVRRQFYEQVKPMHDAFVEPTKALADYVIFTG